MKGGIGAQCKINMRGKKTDALSCRCCTLVNRKDKVLDRIHEREIRECTTMARHQVMLSDSYPE